jgi:hypothetical protein
MALNAKTLAASHQGKSGSTVRLWTAFSTHAAQRALLEGMCHAKTQNVIDQTAAAWILQGFLDSDGIMKTWRSLFRCYGLYCCLRLFGFAFLLWFPCCICEW